VEVAAAIWRKERMGELESADAEVLAAAFEAHWFGTEEAPPRFAAIGLRPDLLDGAAALTAAQGLRAYDAVQLASALAAREADPDCREFACFDDELRPAAARTGFALVP
jgi:predicted nucleic acid-binding protein